MADLLADFKRFVADAEARDANGVTDPRSQYAKWALANPAEVLRWVAFRDEILRGGRPAAPAMTTPHGRELIDAGVLLLDATVPPGVPPTTATNSLKAGQTISGVYPWKITTAGDCVKVEFWADRTKLGEVAGSSPYVFQFDTTKVPAGAHVFGVVKVDPAGVRHPDENRVTATVKRLTVVVTGKPFVGERLTAAIQ